MIIFVNLFSGIFYLCWNDNQYSTSAYHRSQTTYNHYYGSSNLGQAYNKSNDKDVLKTSENQKIELLRKYKELFDQGIITQEEFDKKKESLLK